MTFLKELALGNVARPYNYEIKITMPSDVGVNASTEQYINTLVMSTNMPGSKVSTRDFYIDGRLVKLPGVIQQDQLWSCTFYLDDEYYMRHKIENWMSIIDNYFLRKAPVTGSGLVDIVSSKATSYLTSFANDFFGNASLSSIKNSDNIADGIANTSKFIGKSLFEYFGLNNAGTKNALAASAKVIQKSYSGTTIATCTMYNVFPIEITPISFKDDAVDSVGSFSVTFCYSHHEFEKQNSLLTNVVSSIIN